MAYTQKTIPEFTAGITLNDADLIPYSQGGVTKRIPFGSFKTTIPNLGYIHLTFTSADLSANTLTINHAKNTRIVKLFVYNPGGQYQPVQPTIIDSNNVSINFGGDIEAGDWEYILEYWAAAASAIYPDPIYEPAIIEGVLTPDYTGAALSINVISVYAYRYGSLCFVNMAVATKSTSVIGATTKVCTLPNGPNNTRTFTGGMNDTTRYGSAMGFIQSDGDIYVIMGDKPFTFYFNFTFEIA